jgi:hypothetical protein
MGAHCDGRIHAGRYCGISTSDRNVGTSPFHAHHFRVSLSICGISLFHCAHPTIRRTPLKKVATTSDIAMQILVLASSTVSGHITGQNVIIAGGMEGRLLNVPGEER